MNQDQSPFPSGDENPTAPVVTFPPSAPQDAYTIRIGEDSYLVPMGHVPQDCDCDPCLVAFAAMTAPGCSMALAKHQGSEWVVCKTHGYTIMEYPSPDGPKAVHDEPLA